MMVSFVLSFFPRDVLDEILDLIEPVSEGFPTYSCKQHTGDSRQHIFEKRYCFEVASSRTKRVLNLLS